VGPERVDVLEQGRCEPSELVAGEIVWEVVEGVLGVILFQ
jgi:hypothetical protein